MKSNYSKLLLGLLFFLSCICLSSCKIMTSSDYKKAKEVVTEVCKENDLHGKVTITKLSWTALEFPTYHVATLTLRKLTMIKRYDWNMIQLFMMTGQVHLLLIFRTIRKLFWSRNRLKISRKN